MKFKKKFKKIGVQGYNQLIYRLMTSENRNDRFTDRFRW